jgi:hypothetical protein
LYDDEGSPVTPKLLKLWIQSAEKKANLEQTGRFLASTCSSFSVVMPAYEGAR